MYRQKGILIPLLAISVVFLLGYRGFGWEDNIKPARTTEVIQSGGNKEILDILAFLTIPDALSREAWTTFQNYLEFAKAHDLSGLRSISYQISPTCNDPAKEAECFALMDNVYNIASYFKLSDFRHIQADERQIIMYTDGPVVVMLFFTRDLGGALKVLSMRICLEDETSIEKCVETDPDKRDLNGNGWWDNVESLFYSTRI
ncbi:MAG: hypothetical protein A3G05_01890 [Candidatus Zambryskibacteria bacterium RIFCSPLOWO2_12_FULL_45_14]|uniref:Uncharacterized protein n=2 Tax=Candidatus Zambryskiibacteriota TaxID=1817925 RepID=A0A1G2UKR9_9BACT|nr:MAG: hypothetical protein A3H60_02915 [Candidatus Zambryskibacteria bacterium RIFCSPLOWO2_02_FULL_44_12b]OHB14102.1 MAG: hypothetical protein A3G05_01890 [Candidatus Zambryskibacteria bacterium RIFCSPLOWO2_12_FULL_45_14]